MKSKAFFSGIILSLVIFGFWQKDFFGVLLLTIKGERTVISPLGKAPLSKPQVLGEITTLEGNFDFGQIRAGEGVLSQGAFVYDLTGKRAIFEKNSQQKLQAASTVKIVTAAVALERGKLDEEMTVNYYPTVVGESSMNLAYGERFTLQELLYGLLLVSGNDAAETIAQGIAGKREEFVSWMNEFGKNVGVKNTFFTTPSGLDEDGQYTSAYDLFLFGRYIFEKYPLILQISTTREKYLPATSGHKAYLLRNKLLLLDGFPEILGGKPGLGEGSLLSLVALLEKGDHKILVTLIRTSSLRHDLDQIFKML